MWMSKQDFIELINSMPNNVEFDIKGHWVESGNKLIEYAHFESNYKLGEVDFISFDK